MFTKHSTEDFKKYKEATVMDIESDGLLDKATKIYILGFKMYNKKVVNTFWGDTQEDRIKAMLSWHTENKIPVVCHNAKTFDIPLLEKLYKLDLSDLVVIDTLALSWYLNVDKEKHSLEFLAKDYDVGEKFQIDDEDWKNLTKEQAINRVTSDVEINFAIYQDFIQRLEDMYSLAKDKLDEGVVGGKRVNKKEHLYIDQLKGLSVEDHVARILEYLSFKKDCQRLSEKTKWKVDLPYINKAIEELEVLVADSAEKLEKVMPPVPKYADRKEPKVKFKNNGKKSKAGENWDNLKEDLEKGEVDEWGNLKVKVIKDGFISELIKYEPPNINSHQQVKDFLTLHGWVPETFKYVKDEEALKEWQKEKPIKGSSHMQWNLWKVSKPKDRAIPQVRIEGEEGKELCESVSKLAEKTPEISYLEEYSVIKHRLDVLKGILSRVDEEGYAIATCHGYTNTLRLKHMAPLVNLPASRKKYAEAIRGSLIAEEGSISCGADLSSLEDRVKHMFMIPYDPEYVNKMMSDDYDPHLEAAISAGYISEKDAKDYKEGRLEGEEKLRVYSARHKGKTINYSSVYGIGADKLSISLDTSVEDAKKGLDGYWKLNWSVKAIAEDQVVIKDARDKNWLINPINGFLYNVRGEKDYFSTLAQGTGAFFFDMWLRGVLQREYNKWRRMTLSGQFHDEFIKVIKDRDVFRETLTGMIKESIQEVNETYNLRRKLDCEVQFGKRYSEIH
jgi:DNA polymerase I-like protein with 3'-5' exonuclease and polymerase domains